MIRFISDIHLGMHDWAKLERLKKSLVGPAEIVLLGDVFEYWVGAKHVYMPTYAALADHLAALTRSGVRVSFVVGNRDFMIDSHFARRTGVTLLGKSAVIQAGSRRLYVEHGDFVYNKNFKYHAYRRLADVAAVRATVNRCPAWILQAIGRSMRRISKATTPYFHWTEKQLVMGARRIFQAGHDVFMCGHIHQPQMIKTEFAGKPRTLIVLGDWDHDNIYAEFDGEDFHLRTG